MEGKLLGKRVAPSLGKRSGMDMLNFNKRKAQNGVQVMTVQRVYWISPIRGCVGGDGRQPNEFKGDRGACKVCVVDRWI